MAEKDNRGGARPGAGRKRKGLAEHMADGTARRDRTKRLKPPEPIEIECADMPPVAEYLGKVARTANEVIAPQIYEATWKWLKERNCEQFVKTELIEQYAVYTARWRQCEEAVDTYGLIAKHPKNGGPMSSPYVTMAMSFLKQANQIWAQIFQIVKENSSEAVGSDWKDDPMLRLLMNKPKVN